MRLLTRQAGAMWMKVAAGLAIAGLLGWLALSPRAELRHRTLETLVASGDVGHADPKDLDLFHQLVTNVVRTVPITGQIVINSTPKRGALHFYLTNSRAR